VPVVLITGIPRYLADECARLDVGPVLLKPFSISQLVAAIEAPVAVGIDSRPDLQGPSARRNGRYCPV
jgi:hypothetical protein